MAAGTCFFPNRLNLSPSPHLSAVLGCSKPPGRLKGKGRGGCPHLLGQAKLFPSEKGVVSSVPPGDLLGQVEVWDLPSDGHRILGTAERFQQGMSPPAWPCSAGSLAKRSTVRFCLGFLLKKGEFKTSFKKCDNDLRPFFFQKREFKAFFLNKRRI